MKVYKITLYLYLLFGIGFLVDTIMKFMDGGDYLISLAFTVVAIFMFFFRRKYIRKIEENQKSKE